MGRRTGRSTIVNVAVFIILEGASLCFLYTGSHMQQLWIGHGVHNVMASTWGKVENIHNYLNLKKVNETLSEDIRMLSETVYTPPRDSASGMVWQNTRAGFRMMTANIVTSSSGSQHNYLVVDRGNVDGVKVRDGIITPKGVIGVVESVSEHYAFALSYANQDMVISAKLGREGSVGSLSWDGLHTTTSILSGIPVHVETEPGDTVYTSGFSTIFPKDIPLGTVVEKKIISGSSSDIKVRLFEDFSSIHHVIVVQNTDKKEIQDLMK